MTTRLLIDCDPGVDDAIAILLAAGLPDVEIAAITTVAGNQTLDKVTHNALRIVTLAGLVGVPVAPGCDRPLVRDQILAGDVHGESGMDGPAYFPPSARAADTHAVDVIIDTVMADPGRITLVPIGPLTNIATALRREPKIVQAVRRVVIMGGSYTRGNTTAAAEFNILVDPEAAAVVFDAPWDLTMVGLDVTQQARATPELVQRIAAIDSPASRFVVELLDAVRERFEARGWTGDLAVHDAVAVAAAVDPTLVSGERARVDVELRGQHSYGMTVTDFRCRQAPANAFVPTHLDSERFWTLLIDALGAVDAHVR